MSLSLDDFLKKYSNYFLTLKDIKNMETGEVINVLLLDRSFRDYKITYLDPKRTYSSHWFFSANKRRIVYLGNYRWIIEFELGMCIEHSVHIKVGEEWYPIDSDTNLSDSHLVGWRGPMILWENIGDFFIKK